MAIRLYKPGERKGNKFYIARGRINGETREITCRDLKTKKKTTDRRKARAFANQWESDLLECPDDELEKVGSAPPKTFAQAKEAYCKIKVLNKQREKEIELLVQEFGGRALDSITQHDISEAAIRLYPGTKPQTKNRAVHTHMAAILHYAAENEWCRYRRIKKLKETAVEPQIATDDTVRALLGATAGYQHGLLLTVACQGWRISETLAISWKENINLREQNFSLYVSKADTWKTVAMHPIVFNWLCSIPQQERKSRLFPWSSHYSTYNWLRPLCKDLGLSFRWHMARHRFVTRLKQKRVSDRQIMKAGSWTSERSVSRYESVDLEDARGLLEEAFSWGETVGRKAK